MSKQIQIDELGFYEIIKKPEKYELVTVTFAYDTIKSNIAQLKQAKNKLESYIIKEMEKEKASKLHFFNKDGEDKIVTLKQGNTTCNIKDADDFYRENGFDPFEIGEYVFKPKWSLAKEARKVGGEKQKVIDKIFTRNNPSLKISE